MYCLMSASGFDGLFDVLYHLMCFDVLLMCLARFFDVTFDVQNVCHGFDELFDVLDVLLLLFVPLQLVHALLLARAHL